MNSLRLPNQRDRLGVNLRFNLRFFWNALLIDEQFFILLCTEGGKLPLEVREEDPLVPNFLLQLGNFPLLCLPHNDFVRDFECGGKLILEANEFV